MKFYFEIMYY